MTKPALFTQADVSKVLKGAKAAGLAVSRIEIDRSGRIVAHLGNVAKDAGKDDDGAGPNEWDERIRAKKERPSAQRH